MHRAWLPVLTLAVASGLVLGAGLAPTPATATTVTYNFTGDIFKSETPLTSTIFTSDTVKGSFTIDDSKPANPAQTPQLGIYPGAVTAYSMTFQGAGYTVTQGAGTNSVTLINDSSLGPLGGVGDRWELLTDATAATAINGFAPHEFRIQLDGDTGGANGGVSALLANTDLQGPPGIITNPALTSNMFRVIFEDASMNTRVVLGHLTSLTAVPLPASLILFGAGLVALIGLGAGKWRTGPSGLA